MDNELKFENKIYLSSKYAGEKFGYTNDYVARLCRQGKIEGRMVGRSWYAEEESLKAFISKNDGEKLERDQKLSEERKREYRVRIPNPVLTALGEDVELPKVSIPKISLPQSVHREIIFSPALLPPIDAAALLRRKINLPNPESIIPHIALKKINLPPVSSPAFKAVPSEIRSLPQVSVSDFERRVVTLALSILVVATAYQSHTFLASPKAEALALNASAHGREIALALHTRVVEVAAVAIEAGENFPSTPSELKSFAYNSPKNFLAFVSRAGNETSNLFAVEDQEIGNAYSAWNAAQSIDPEKALYVLTYPGDQLEKLSLRAVHGGKTFAADFVESGKKLAVGFVSGSKGLFFGGWTEGKTLALNLSEDLKNLARNTHEGSVELASQTLAKAESIPPGIIAGLRVEIPGSASPRNLLASVPEFNFDFPHIGAGALVSVAQSVEDFWNIFWGRTRLAVREITSGIPTENTEKPAESEGVKSDVPVRSTIVVAPQEKAKELKDQVEQTFSDEVLVYPDETGRSGVIKPVFKTQSEQSYVYMLVPVKEKGLK